MELTKQTFPTGIKRYKTNVMSASMRAIFHKDFYDGCMLLRKFNEGNIQENLLKIHNSVLAPNGSFNSFLSYFTKHESNHTYPMFTCNSINGFNLLTEYRQVTIHHKSDYYQTPKRLECVPGAINLVENPPQYIPITSGMKFRIDIDTSELILYNTPYEGGLIRNKGYTQIQKHIDELIKLSIQQIKTLSMILPSGEVDIPSNIAYRDSAEACLDLPKSIDKLIDGTAQLEDYINICATFGLITKKWSRTECKHVIKFTGIESKPLKWKAGIRKQIMFTYGGLSLPDNYQEWFDSE